ncbi:hypothetical protein DERP_001519 [Dermatophagoides pteronyssinus]|uniref:Uncharacterized protein n=1 Tax=Dermatophagoides pteronyssinus TaxID=6956 RepID=A0ABQ8JF63_DERPT|nr:hypothetical protein DERP_001519 [Dermatophagoides pteronyssinus]
MEVVVLLLRFLCFGYTTTTATLMAFLMKEMKGKKIPIHVSIIFVFTMDTSISAATAVITVYISKCGNKDTISSRCYTQIYGP